jgi:hypothetical protein
MLRLLKCLAAVALFALSSFLLSIFCNPNSPQHINTTTQPTQPKIPNEARSAVFWDGSRFELIVLH